MTTTFADPSADTAFLDGIMEALIVLSNVAEGDFNASVTVPEAGDEAFRALFEGINEMIRSLSVEKARTLAYQRDLEEKLAMIDQQRTAIAELSTPIMEVWDGILCLPVVGIMDTARSAEMTHALLEAVVEKPTRCCI